jgi:hypothetical protein
MRNRGGDDGCIEQAVGIIGVGFGAQVYAPAFASEGWEVAALCSRHREKARSAAEPRRRAMSIPIRWR